MDSSQENDPYRDERIALLRYYNSQCMTHGGYFIAILVGLLTIISRWTTFTTNIIAGICFWSIVIFLILLCAYTVGRIFWWGFLASKVLRVGKKKIEEEKKKQSGKEEKNQILMTILHDATATEVRNKHPLTRLFEKRTSEAIDGISKRLQKFIPTEKTYCSYCGTRNVKDDVYCKKCGKKIT